MRSLTILSLLLVAVTFGTALAHALELPGKLRLDESTYKKVQTIIPGFTVGGLVGEFGGIVALAVLLTLIPYGTTRFWWTAPALLLMLATHATYWLLTHPVNNFWVKDVALSAAGSTFFSAFARGQTWTELRNASELSHVVRTCFSGLGLIAIAVATSLLGSSAT
jgi:hypothetical protein